MGKRFILNADDFALTKAHNLAVLKGYEKGLLTGASLCTNTEAFEDAVNNIIPKCKNLDIGIHLNIMEGKSLTDCPLLTDAYGYFRKSYGYFILNQNNKNVLYQIENEFKKQIEKALEHNIPINHIDSHVHIHAIPKIFELSAKLAKEYNINFIRTQNEKAYLAFPEVLSYKYFINLIKIGLLKYYTIQNKKITRNLKLSTNDYTIGIGYTGMMSSNTVISGLKNIKKGYVETIIHPCKYNDLTQANSHTKEFEIALDLKLKEQIKNLGFELTRINEI